MKVRFALSSAVLAAVIAGSGIVVAQAPVDNIDPARHPHLSQAQHLVTQASQQIRVAQQANRDLLGGHAARALQLLDQANNELKMAAETANRNHK